MRSSVLVNLFPKVFLVHRIFIFKDLVKTNSIKDKLMKICTEKQSKGPLLQCIIIVLSPSVINAYKKKNKSLNMYVPEIEDRVKTGC